MSWQPKSRIGTDPFQVPVENRDPVRRLRGRLPAPVTIWTAYDEDREPSGLTVSSMLVAKGAPPAVLGLVGDLSDVWRAIEASGRFVVHVVGEGAERIADDFAGRHPGPDAPFGSLGTIAGDWGPEIEMFGTLARCTLVSVADAGYSLLVQGSVDEVTVDDSSSRPLVHHRGRYARLDGTP